MTFRVASIGDGTRIWRLLRAIRIEGKAHHAVGAFHDRLDLEAGLAQYADVAVERAQRHTEPAAVVVDAHELPAGEARGQPTEADEAEPERSGACIRRARIVARPGVRRGCAEAGGCHRWTYLHRVTDSVGVSAPAESPMSSCACRAYDYFALARTFGKLICRCDRRSVAQGDAVRDERAVAPITEYRDALAGGRLRSGRADNGAFFEVDGHRVALNAGDGEAVRHELADSTEQLVVAFVGSRVPGAPIRTGHRHGRCARVGDLGRADRGGRGEDADSDSERSDDFDCGRFLAHSTVYRTRRDIRPSTSSG